MENRGPRAPGSALKNLGNMTRLGEFENVFVGIVVRRYGLDSGPGGSLNLAHAGGNMRLDVAGTAMFASGLAFIGVDGLQEGEILAAVRAMVFVEGHENSANAGKILGCKLLNNRI